MKPSRLERRASFLLGRSQGSLLCAFCTHAKTAHSQNGCSYKWCDCSGFLPIMAGGAEDEEDTQAPEVNAVLGEAEATVIEPGGADNSMESETTIDESVNVTVVTPEPEAPAEPEAHSHEELAHCEHCEEHAARLTALEAFQAGIAAELEEVEEVAEDGELAEEAPVEEAPAEEPAEEEITDEAPKRVHLFHRKVFG